MDNVVAEAAGWVVAKSISVTPIDAQPGETIHVRTIFENENWIPAYAVLQVKLDGVIIEEWCTLGVCAAFFESREVRPWEFDYTLPSSISPGISHRIEALEQGQVLPAYLDFTVSAPPPPGQRNVSFSSIPADAQIYVSEVYRGNTPLTIPLSSGTYAVRAVYAGQEQAKNIQVIAGSGSMSVPFAFTQAVPFDLTKWLSDNKWYIGGGVAALAVLYLAVKKPQTLRQGVSKAYALAGKGYEKAKEVLI